MGLIGGVVGSLIGIGLDMYQTNEDNKAKEESIKAQRKAAKLKFSALEDSVNVMKANNMENTINITGEILRVGAEKSRDTANAIEQAASTNIAQSEGLTSGRSQGRQLAALYTQGNKVMQKATNETRSMMNQVVDNQDKNTNALNNKLIGAHQELTAILANEGTVTDGTISAINSGIQLGTTGYQLFDT